MAPVASLGVFTETSPPETGSCSKLVRGDSNRHEQSSGDFKVPGVYHSATPASTLDYEARAAYQSSRVTILSRRRPRAAPAGLLRRPEHLVAVREAAERAIMRWWLTANRQP